jgi:hypothetical protein
LRRGPLSTEVFYTQLRKSPLCERTGKNALTAELTVELRDAHSPAVLDNLITVESPGF